jgi:hypothetical protein
MTTQKAPANKDNVASQLDTIPESVARHVIELLGGREKAFQTLTSDHQSVTSRWEQDIATIGRILRAHLFVEHFLSEYLQSKNPNLGSLEEARISFGQKITLLAAGRPEIEYLLPGIRRLNIIRNRIAHSLRAELTQNDTDVFLQVKLFAAMRNEMAKSSKRVPSSDHVDIMEEFAMHAGFALHQGPMTEVLAEAIRLAQQDCKSI